MVNCSNVNDYFDINGTQGAIFSTNVNREQIKSIRFEHEGGVITRLVYITFMCLADTTAWNVVYFSINFIGVTLLAN